MNLILVFISLFFISTLGYAKFSYTCSPVNASEPAHYNDCLSTVQLSFSKNFRELSFEANECGVNENSLRDLSYKPRATERLSAYIYRDVLAAGECTLDAVVLESMLLGANKASLILEQAHTCGEYKAFRYECIIKH